MCMEVKSILCVVRAIYYLLNGSKVIPLYHFFEAPSLFADVSSCFSAAGFGIEPGMIDFSVTIIYSC